MANQPTNSPAEILQVVLNVPFSGMESMCGWLQKNTSGYLVGEHPPAKRKETHCHILIEGLKVSREALRKAVLKVSPGRGQYAIMSVTQKENKPYEREALAVYIIKGHIEYHKSSSYGDFLVEVWSKKWREPAVSSVVPTIATTEKIKPLTMFDHCEEIVQRLPWSRKEYFTNPDLIDRTKVLETIQVYTREKRIAIHSTKFEEWYDCVINAAFPEHYLKLVTARINYRHRFVYN